MIVVLKIGIKALERIIRSVKTLNKQAQLFLEYYAKNYENKVKKNHFFFFLVFFYDYIYFRTCETFGDV